MNRATCDVRKKHDCEHLPKENQVNLGTYASCDLAVTHAKNIGKPSTINCKTCCE